MIQRRSKLSGRRLIEFCETHKIYNASNFFPVETEPVQIPAENPPIIPEPDVLPMTTPPAVAVESNEGEAYLYLKFIFNKKLSTTKAV